MSKNKIFIILGVVVIVIAAALAFTNSKSGSGKAPAANSPEPAVSASYKMADVAGHKDASSCWSAINGNVYNLTSWIAKHPGGEGAILGICGKDGSDAFNSQHGGQGKPENVLETFKIGTLAN